jgi:hypothetical protein
LLQEIVLVLLAMIFLLYETLAKVCELISGQKCLCPPKTTLLSVLVRNLRKGE